MTTAVCPICSGPQMPNHPAGILAIQHTAQCPLLMFEDGTAVNDNVRIMCGYPALRPATPTERILLAALGYTLPDQLDTNVQQVTRGIRLRTWPDLNQPTTTTESETP